ncbi:MAG: DUF368 domain-containing protein [Bacilli bacterium]|nr:DUF368 domain-containing protein [Bacilli bacterium]
MNYLKLIFKGFIVGLGKIIPGVSGGMLAILLGVYEESVQAIAHFFRDTKKNILFLGVLGIGASLAIVFMSGVIDFSLENYYLPTMLLFIGLMLGGSRSLKREIEGTNCKDYVFQLVVPFLFMISIQFFQNGTFLINENYSYFLIFLFGIIDAITMVVPGISGTAILMLLGFYPLLLETFSHLLDPSYLSNTLQIMLPFGLGILIGVLITVKIVSFLLERHSVSFHYVIISFFFSSILLLFLQTFKNNYTMGTVIVSFLFLILGYFISKFLDSHYNL